MPAKPPTAFFFINEAENHQRDFKWFNLMLK
jgi:hypothetical protein